jgi:hypothetical protein
LAEWANRFDQGGQLLSELLREEVAQIVASPDEIEEELRSLFHALA